MMRAVHLMVLGCFLVGAGIGVVAADDGMVSVSFESERWQLAGGRIVDHLGRVALSGGATLPDVTFTDGVVEVDVAVTGATSYPGIDFRIQSGGDVESIYLRPHRISRYGDGVQYAPTFNGVSCWQLYNGDGYTAGVDIPAGEWFTLRLEVEGDRARVFLSGSEQPALVIEDLKREKSAGGIGLRGPADGSAFFSNFRYSLERPEDFGPTEWQDIPPGFITDWQVSGPIDQESAAADDLPGSEVFEGLTWHQVVAEPSGLINLSRHMARTGPVPDAVLARTTVSSDEAVVRPLDIGYSDHVSVYVNGKIVFAGRSAYRERDPSFLGIIGPFDTLYLPLNKGDNQLVIKVTEAFGGWGLMARWGDAVHLADGVTKVWSTGPDFRVPESVVWDSKRRVFFVSNYDGYNPSRGEGLQSISRISFDGTEVEIDWVTGLRNPAGLAVDGDRLWVSERTGLAAIDIEMAAIVERYDAPQPAFLNDTAVDGKGGVWVSDSRNGRIYRLVDGALEVWLEGDDLQRPNGIHVMGGELLIGVNGDHSLKAADLETGELRTVARLGPGIIDGVSSDDDGNIIASHWEGRVLKIAPDGTVTKLLDTTVAEDQCADLEVVDELGLVVIPTFFDGRVTAYRLSRDQVPGAAETP